MNDRIMDAIVRERRDALYEQAKNERGVRTLARRPRSLRAAAATALNVVGGACYKLSAVISG
jgi:hypothetical protein